MTPQPHHRRHGVSVAVVCYSTLLTWVTVLKRQPVSDAKESWPTTTHLSRPFPFATVISWAEISMEEYVPYWIMHGGEYFWRFLAFISLIQVSLSCYFWINELCTVYHFVRSPHQLMSELWLAATQLHATQNRTGPILSTRITCGCSKPSNALWHGFELAHGVNSTKFMSICSCVVCGCGVRLWLWHMSAVALKQILCRLLLGLHSSGQGSGQWNCTDTVTDSTFLLIGHLHLLFRCLLGEL